MEYKKPYLILVDATTEVIDKIENLDKQIIKEFLIAAQKLAEEAYISFEEENK